MRARGRARACMCVTRGIRMSSKNKKRLFFSPKKKKKKKSCCKRSVQKKLFVRVNNARNSVKSSEKQWKL